MSNTAKRIVVVSDLHCGSTAALWNCGGKQTQTELLARWQDCIAHFGARPDILICNGDAIDGHQHKGGDLLENGRELGAQIGAAVGLLRMWRAREYFIVSGSGYHVSDTGDESERDLAVRLESHGERATFTRKLNLLVNGWFRLQCRHHIGSSGIPHGRMTPQMRSKTWGALNAAQTGGKPPHLSIFSHVHYWTYAEDFSGAVMTTPAWQALGGRYGDERCDGHCDIGAVQITIGGRECNGHAWSKRLYPAAVVNRTVRR